MCKNLYYFTHGKWDKFINKPLSKSNRTDINLNS